MARFSQSEQEILREFREAKEYIKKNPITKVVETPQGDVIIPIKALAFNSPSVSKDRFASSSDFGHPAANNTVSVYFHHTKDKFMLAEELMIEHGLDKSAALELAAELSIGKQYIGAGIRSKFDDEGIFYNLVVSRRNRYKAVIKKLAEEGHLDSSTGVKFRENDPNDPHLIKSWHPLADLTLTPMPDDPNTNVVHEKGANLMPEENTGTPPQNDSGEAVKNPLIEQIDTAFPDTVDKSAPGEQVSMAEVLAALNGLTESVNTLTEKMMTIDTNVGHIQEAMPHLIEKVAKFMSEDVAALVAKSASQSSIERAARQSVSPPQKHNPSKPVQPSVNSSFPVSAPGGK